MIMAVSLAIPAGVSFSSQTVKAEGLTSETKDGDAFYDFRDGSVVPTDTDGKSDITYGNLTIKVGTKNAFNYHGSSHGTLFKDGNSFEIKSKRSYKNHSRWLSVFTVWFYNSFKCRWLLHRDKRS